LTSLLESYDIKSVGHGYDKGEYLGNGNSKQRRSSTRAQDHEIAGAFDKAAAVAPLLYPSPFAVRNPCSSVANAFDVAVAGPDQYFAR
jgi:hypothetical protein